jgi:hypothetical protein
VGKPKNGGGTPDTRLPGEVVGQAHKQMDDNVGVPRAMMGMYSGDAHIVVAMGSTHEIGPPWGILSPCSKLPNMGLFGADWGAEFGPGLL